MRITSTAFQWKQTNHSLIVLTSLKKSIPFCSRFLSFRCLKLERWFFNIHNPFQHSLVKKFQSLPLWHICWRILSISHKIVLFRKTKLPKNLTTRSIIIPQFQRNKSFKLVSLSNINSRWSPSRLWLYSIENTERKDGIKGGGKQITIKVLSPQYDCAW